jgi:hypothetical protein
MTWALTLLAAAPTGRRPGLSKPTEAAQSKVPRITPETLIRVTLNLTLAARWMIVQTSDFRLTTGPSTPPEETAQKQVVLKYRHWTGLLCYTGIARWFSHDTAQWLDRILTHGPGEQRQPREILEVLVKQGGWLRRVHEARRRHTFTLTLFANKLPWVRAHSLPGGRRDNTTSTYRSDMELQRRTSPVADWLQGHNEHGSFRLVVRGSAFTP